MKEKDNSNSDVYQIVSALLFVFVVSIIIGFLFNDGTIYSSIIQFILKVSGTLMSFILKSGTMSIAIAGLFIAIGIR